MVNDWIVANLNNPDFTVSDFQNIADMSTSNTQLLSKDQYLKSDFIKNNDAFKDSQGNFSQKKFDNFYNSAARSFQDFRTNNTTDGLEYDVFDVRRTPNSKVKKDDLAIYKSLNNPDRQQIGIEGINIWSDPELSKAEIAQSQQVFNTAIGKFEDYTPQNQALFNGKIDFGLSWIKSLFSDPLVLATYDKDEVDKYGKKHYKGEYKLNSNGTYYYETLNGRSPVGKEVLSSLDNLTIEGTKLNKYDFFDSDDIEKSVTGSIAKNITSLIPIFIGGTVGATYSSLIIAREMAKSMPMLYNISTALLGSPDTPTWMNTIAAMGDKFTSGTSQHAKTKTFAFENFANLVSDVALQWGQQKSIAQAFNKIKGNQNLVEDAYKNAQALYLSKAIQPEWMTQAGNPEKWMESALGKACIKKFVPAAEKVMVQQSQLGRDASLMYMAIISNSDVYNDAVQQGATRKEAAAVALGSTLGMFAVDKYAHLGEIFFDDATEDSVKAARKAIKNELTGDKGLREVLTNGIINNPEVQQNGAKRYLSIINNSANKIKNLFNNFNEDLKYHTLGFFGKAIGEGTEEVAEELVTDTAKSIYELAGYLGADTSVKDIGAWDNAFDRYTMSFLGGAVGGGIFYAKEALTNIKANKHDQELAALIRNGHVQELRDYVETLRKKGKLGSTNLSGTKYIETTDDSGNITGRTWLTADDSTDTQNEIIAKHLNNKITALEAVINNNELDLSDEQLFNNMVLQESRYKAYQDNAAITGYYDQFNDLFNDITTAQANYETASNTVDGTVNGKVIPNDNYLHGLTPEQQATRTENLEKLKQKLEEARLKKDQFLSGEVSIDYIRKLNFAMDKVLHSQFMNIDQDQLWESLFPGKKKEDASKEDIKRFYEELDKQQRFTSKEQLTQAWNRFKSIEETLKPTLHNLGEESSEYISYFQQFQTLIENINSLDRRNKSWNDKLDIESEEEFNNKDIKLETESEEDFFNRKNNRIKALNEYNEKQDADWVSKVDNILSKIKYQVDPITLQGLDKIIPKRIKDIIRYKASQYPELEDSLDTLKIDLSNINELKEQLKKVQNTRITKQLFDNVHQLSSDNFSDLDGDKTSIDQVLDDGNEYIFKDLDNEDLVKETLYDILNPEDAEKAFNLLVSLRPYVDDNTDIVEFLRTPSFNVDESLKIEPFIDSAISDIQNNPIFKLRQKLRTSIKNPLLEMTKELVGKVLDEKQQKDVARMLDLIQSKYDTLDSVDSLELDSEQLKTLTIARDALSLISTYIYAAGSTPSSTNSIGHNKVINEYIEKHHVDGIELLPEINTDYAILFQSSVGQFLDNINFWIDLSNRNAINKRKLFTETDRALVRSFTGFWQNNNFKITINGHNYNLLEGVHNDANNSVNLYNYEHIFYQNVQKVLEDEKIDIKQFLEQSKLLDSFVEYNNLDQQSVSRLSPQLQYKQLSSYDKLVYFSTILALNPATFYNFIKTETNNNDQQAPIASQEYGIRVGIAHTNQTFKDILEYAFSKSGSNMYNSSNTTIITGDAGAGKTSVVAKGITHFLGPDTTIYCAGPTMQQAHGLFNSIQQGTEIEVTDILKKILGSQYIEIEEDLKIPLNDPKNGLSKDSKYFHVYNNNGLITSVIHPENINFTDLEDSPKVIIIDESTHIPAVYLQILNEYQKKHNGELILVGDKKQRGYSNKQNAISNILVGDLFAIRTPELNVSLRDNNIQKANNLTQVRTLVGQALDNIETMSTEDWKSYEDTLNSIIPKIEFHYYNQDSLAGELITNTLSNDIISKLTGTIGFIGNSSSTNYKQLVDAGLHPKLLSMDEMQGQEFDYVVIDQKLNPKNKLEFLQDLYTLMSRGKTASIFIDNGLSSIIKPSIRDDYTTKAPSLTDKVNGESIIDVLRKEKLNNLALYDLSDSETLSTATTSEESIPPTDFKAPETIVDDKEEIIDHEIGEEAKPDIETRVFDDIDTEFTILSYGDVIYTGVQEEDSEEISPSNGKKYKGKRWILNHGTTRRGISALASEDSIFWYKDKLKYQQLLYNVQSAIMFNVALDATDIDGNYIIPEDIRTKFNVDDWKKGTIEVEFRPIDNEVKPLGSSLPDIGMEYKGNKFIANIVFKVKDKEDNICIFDLSGINNPNTFKNNIDIIKSNLQKKIDKESDADRKNKLQNTLNNIEISLSKYTNLFDSWFNQYQKDGYFSINVTNSIVNRGLTSFVKRKGPNLRLEGTVDPNNVDKPSLKNFKNLNPGYVVSDIYTYASNNPDLLKIDPSIKGRAVVFVSENTLLKPEELIHKYIQQKTDPKHNTPIVRMIKLNNYGLRFSQLYDDKLLSKTIKKGSNSLPFRANYHGIQMFVSMWNWRAALDNFNKALETWKANNKYDTTKVDNIIKAAYDIYKNPDSKDAILTKYDLNQSDLDNLNHFNFEICKNIPIFRLGYSTTNDFHIQRFKVSGSEAYRGKDEANLIVINPSKVQQFYKLTNRILQAIIPSSVGIPTLGVQLLKLDGTTWNSNEYIDIENAKHQRTLSGLFKQNLSIEDKDGNLLIYKDGIQWSMIPKLIDRFVKNIAFYQNNPDQLSGSYGESVTVKLDSGKPTERIIHLQFGDLIADKVILDNDSNKGKFDESLYNMFDLMFHGTTDDIHRKYTKENPLIQATDARFPQGFFINPDITRKSVAGGTDIGINYNGETVFYPIETPGEFFTVDIDMRNLGISLSLDSLITSTTTSIKSTSTTSTETYTEDSRNKELQELYDTYGIDEDIDEEEALDIINQRIHDKLVKTLGLSSNPKTTIINYSLNSEGLLITSTLDNLIASILGTNKYNINVIENEGEQTIQIESNGETYILNPSTLDLQKESIIGVLSTQQPYGGTTIIDAFNNFVNININELNNTDIDVDTDEILYPDVKDNESLKRFINDLNTLSKADSEEEIEDIKTKITEDMDYVTYLSYIEEKQEELFNLLFGCL